MTQSGPLLSDPTYLELKDRFSGLAVLVGSMALCVGFSFWAKDVARPEALIQPAAATTRGIAGWPHAVDALGTLELARRSSRPRELRQIVLEGVKSDGTIDVVTGPGSLTYLFQNIAKDPPPLPPKDPKSKAAPPKPIPCPRQTVRVRRDGIQPQQEIRDHRCPVAFQEPLPPPSCGPRELWARAIEKGASIRQMAHMEYYRAKAGPAWRMTFPADRFEMVLSSDCQRELNRSEARMLTR